MLVDDRTPGWDFTASLPKEAATTTLEGGDTGRRWTASSNLT
jgi:hypothetical protein